MRKIVAGLLGGKTAGSKVMVSPLCASSNAWRKVPGPLSAVLVTTMVLPWACGAGATSSSTSSGGAGVGVGVGITGVPAGPVHDITRRSIAIAAGVTSLTNFTFVLPFPRVCCVDLPSAYVNYSLTSHIILLFMG